MTPPYRSHEDQSLGQPRETTTDACERLHDIDACADKSCPAFGYCPKAVRKPVASTQPHPQPRPKQRIETGAPK